MDLYFAPLACSMATRIALYEAGANAQYIHARPQAKRSAGRLGLQRRSTRSAWCRCCAPTMAKC